VELFDLTFEQEPGRKRESNVKFAPLGGNCCDDDFGISGGDAEMSYAIEKIEGIGPKNAEVLRGHGITRTHHLLEQGASRKGRKTVAEKTGIDEKKILKWANMCDLMRVRGVGEEYSELLEVAGVDTIKELRNRKPDNLRKSMVEANEKKKLVRQLPSLKQVESWVQQAKDLDPVMSY